jgi:putative restriction endonuclease
MVKGVFQTRISPAYDDVPERHYHFPRMYLNQAERTVGDWIVYYEPRRSEGERSGGRSAYFAMALVTGIRPDPFRPDHFYADVDEFQQFDRAVPFREQTGFYYETALQNADGSTNKGAAGRAVRNMPEGEFDLILKSGFAPDLAADAGQASDGFGEAPVVFERPVIETVVSRPFRDRAFSRQIQEVYDKRCAMTGLRIINGGGRAEAQAAHIQPVHQHGPDSVRNGLALSSTIHWMFDRGLLSIDDDFRILKAHRALPDDAARLLNPTGYLNVPGEQRFQPHREFLRFHRENVFKG